MKTVTELQYEFARKRVEDLLPLIDASAPISDSLKAELVILSDIILDYENEQSPIRIF